MLRIIHLLAAGLATLTIAAFFTSTLLVEVFGSHAAVASVKHLIVFPGLFVLVPALVATGGTGFVLAKARPGRLVQAVELLAGATNLTLMGLNIRDGLILSGRLRPNRPASATQ